MAAQFLDLPDEILSKIFRYLSAKDFCKTGAVCRRFREIDQDGELIWKYYCRRDYGVDENFLWNGWTYKEFYTNALQKYDFLFGWWKRNIQHFGGLFLVKMEKDSIVGYECLPPVDDFNVTIMAWVGLAVVPEGTDYSRETFNRLRFIRAFVIRPIEKETAVFCCQSDQSEACSSNEHRMDIERIDSGFKIVCRQPDKHAFDCKYYLRLLHGIQVNDDDVDVVMEEYFQSGYELQEKFSLFAEGSVQSDFERLHVQRLIPNTVTPQCIKPGFYSSLYSLHGWEILNFQYNGNLLEGIKVRGDPNVPAGKISVRVFLKQPIVLTAEDQIAMDNIRKVIDDAQQNGWESQKFDMSLQPFRIPPDCHIMNDSNDQPNFCRCRYLAECQVAETGFTEPRFEEALFTGFDDDTFAILWLGSQTFFHYFRATNADDLGL